MRRSILLTVVLLALTGCATTDEDFLYYGKGPYVVHGTTWIGKTPAEVDRRETMHMQWAPYHHVGVTVAPATTWFYGEAPGWRPKEVIDAERERRESLDAWLNGRKVASPDISASAKDEERVEEPAVIASTDNGPIVLSRTSQSTVPQEVLDQWKIKPSPYPPGVEVRNNTHILYFPRDVSELTYEQSRYLERVFAQLAAGYPRVINVSGYTSEPGTEQRNRNLAINRARSVERFAQKVGINDHVLYQALPACCYQAPNDSEPNRAKNRRVEITIGMASMKVPVTNGKEDEKALDTAISFVKELQATTAVIYPLGEEPASLDAARRAAAALLENGFSTRIEPARKSDSAALIIQPHRT